MSARYDWETIRAEYEAGATMGELSRRHGVSKTAISKRARAESWTQDISGTINRMAEAKVYGLVDIVNPKKKVEAQKRAAGAVASVMLRHKEEWKRHQALIDDALKAGDFNKAKLAKITAETLKIRQEGERKAWGIADKSSVDMTSSDGSMSPPKVIDVIFVNADNTQREEGHS